MDSLTVEQATEKIIKRLISADAPVSFADLVVASGCEDIPDKLGLLLETLTKIEVLELSADGYSARDKKSAAEFSSTRWDQDDWAATGLRRLQDAIIDHFKTDPVFDNAAFIRVCKENRVFFESNEGSFKFLDALKLRRVMVEDHKGVGRTAYVRPDKDLLEVADLKYGNLLDSVDDEISEIRLLSPAQAAARTAEDERMERAREKDEREKKEREWVEKVRVFVSDRDSVTTKEVLRGIGVEASQDGKDSKIVASILKQFGFKASTPTVNGKQVKTFVRTPPPSKVENRETPVEQDVEKVIGEVVDLAVAARLAAPAGDDVTGASSDDLLMEKALQYLDQKGIIFPSVFREFYQEEGVEVTSEKAGELLQDAGLEQVLIHFIDRELPGRVFKRATVSTEDAAFLYFKGKAEVEEDGSIRVVGPSKRGLVSRKPETIVPPPPQQVADPPEAEDPFSEPVGTTPSQPPAEAQPYDRQSGQMPEGWEGVVPRFLKGRRTVTVSEAMFAVVGKRAFEYGNSQAARVAKELASHGFVSKTYHGTKIYVLNGERVSDQEMREELYISCPSPPDYIEKSLPKIERVRIHDFEEALLRLSDHTKRMRRAEIFPTNFDVIWQISVLDYLEKVGLAIRFGDRFDTLYAGEKDKIQSVIGDGYPEDLISSGTVKARESEPPRESQPPAADPVDEGEGEDLPEQPKDKDALIAAMYQALENHREEIKSLKRRVKALERGAKDG